MGRGLLIALVVLAAPGFALGQDVTARCMEPPEPQCLRLAGYGGGFANEYAFEACRSSVNSYLTQLEFWLGCVRREGAVVADATVDKFNCLADGKSWTGSICF